MSDSKQESEIIFGEIFDITMALQYHEQLNELLNDQKQISLNAEKVEKVDGAGLQILLAFFIVAEKLNLQVVWTGASEIFLKNAEVLGISEKIGFAK
jgi:ABC-type transporter Mla MlaB component